MIYEIFFLTHFQFFKFSNSISGHTCSDYPYFCQDFLSYNSIFSRQFVLYYYLANFLKVDFAGKYHLKK